MSPLWHFLLVGGATFIGGFFVGMGVAETDDRPEPTSLQRYVRGGNHHENAE